LLVIGSKHKGRREISNKKFRLISITVVFSCYINMMPSTIVDN